jgi:hypothetical protein
MRKNEEVPVEKAKEGEHGGAHGRRWAEHKAPVTDLSADI